MRFNGHRCTRWTTDAAVLSERLFHSLPTLHTAALKTFDAKVRYCLEHGLSLRCPMPMAPSGCLAGYFPATARSWACTTFQPRAMLLLNTSNSSRDWAKASDCEPGCNAQQRASACKFPASGTRHGGAVLQKPVKLGTGHMHEELQFLVGDQCAGGCCKSWRWPFTDRTKTKHMLWAAKPWLFEICSFVGSARTRHHLPLQATFDILVRHALFRWS